MTKIIKNSFGNFLVVLLIFSIVTGWVFSGWPQVWEKPSIPPRIEEVLAGTERQSPDGETFTLLELTGAYTDVDDDPDSPDGLWLAASGNNINTSVLASFPTPSGNPTTGAGLQNFRALVREFDLGQTGTPKARIDLYENGGLLASGTLVDVVGSTIITLAWDASLLTNANGSGVEAFVFGKKSGGSSTARNSVEPGAIEWNVDYTTATNPTFDSGQEPHEDPASHNGAGTGGTADNPVNVGSNVTFKATATDPQTDNWTLLVCETDGVTGIACDGGAEDTYCTSSSTASSSEASCSYTALAGDTESNAWYAYACDASSCSGNSNTGNGGNTGTPFYVNHVPTFSTYSDDSPANPGATVTWTTTASDTDSDAATDTVSLYVCDASGFTGGASPACTGTLLCSQTGQASNPTCNDVLDNPEPDGTYNAYGYVIDNHGLQASGGSHGTDSTLTVNNVAPSISNTSIQLLDTDETGNLTLTVENGETQDFFVKFVVTDDNSCQNISAGDEISSAIIHVYRSGVLQANCDIDGEDDNNNCYANAHTGTGGLCVQDTSVNDCTGDTDADVGWRCEFPLQYHADPTIAGAPLAAQNWLASVQADDDDGANTGLVEDADGNEVDEFLAFNLSTGSIAYGNVAAGNDSVEQTTTLQATGNVGLDENLSGGNAGGDGMCVSDYPTCAGLKIATLQQVYNLTASQGWPSGTALSFSATEAEININKTTTGTPASGDTYWVLRVPGGQGDGVYGGEDTIDGVRAENGDW